MFFVLKKMYLNFFRIMRSRTFFTFMLLVIFPFIISGQDNLYFNRSLQEFASKMQISSGNPGYRVIDHKNSQVEGSEYFNEEFMEGDIFTSDKERFTGVPMRFNAYHGEVEVMMPDKTIWTLTNTGGIVKIILNSSTLVHRRFITDSGEASGFLVLVYNGKNVLYRRDYKVFLEGKPSNGIVNEIPSKIVSRPAEYYIDTGNGLPRFFKTSRDIAEIVGTHSQEINSFTKKEKINFKKEEDLVKLLFYIDSLK